MNQRVGGQHDRREERGAEQSPTHLFQHHYEFDIAESLSSVLLWDYQTL